MGVNKKGFVFSLDAAFALLLILSAFFAADFFLFKAETSGWPNLSNKRQAEDIMFLMDRGDVLQSMDSNKVQDFIDNALIKNLDMRVELQTFSYTDNNFVLQQTVNVGPSVPSDRDIIKGRRLFLIFDDVNLTVDRYGNAEYWVWLK